MTMLYLVGHDQEWCAPLPDLASESPQVFSSMTLISSGNPKLCIEGWEESGPMDHPAEKHQSRTFPK